MTDSEERVAQWKATDGELRNIEWLGDRGQLTCRQNAIELRLTKRTPRGMLSTIRVRAADAERLFGPKSESQGEAA
jgi:hypothetical protein